MGRERLKKNNWHIPPGGLPGRMKEPLPWKEARKNRVRSREITIFNVFMDHHSGYAER